MSKRGELKWFDRDAATHKQSERIMESIGKVEKKIIKGFKIEQADIPALVLKAIGAPEGTTLTDEVGEDGQPTGNWLATWNHTPAKRKPKSAAAA